MKLVLLNLKFSPNLGDGIIAECMEGVLQSSHPGISIVTCDIAGRNDYGHGINRSRALLLALLERLPSSLRRLLVASCLKPVVQFRLQRHYRRSMHGADVALLGGGQIIADSDLNFPLKIAAVAGVASDLNIPLGIFAAGVGTSCSPAGMKLFHSALSSKVFAAWLRDERSLHRWNEVFAPPSGSVVNDPGLLASMIWPSTSEARAGRATIGIGVTNPSTLNLHADRPGLDHSRWRQLLATLSEELVQRGYRVQLFTNGARDDLSFAETVYGSVGAELRARDEVLAAPSLHRPSELAYLIAGFDGVVAHRLHACIAAYSYGVPHVGLGWDHKLDSFFGSVGRQAYMLADIDPQPHEIADLLERSLAEGINGEERRKAIDDTKRQIEDLGSRLTALVRPDLVANPVQPGYHRSGSPA